MTSTISTRSGVPAPDLRVVFGILSLAAVCLVGCGAAPAGPGETNLTDRDEAAAATAGTVTEDGLADAFSSFLEAFQNSDLDSQFTLGFGYHLGLCTEKVAGADGQRARGSATLDLNTGHVTAHLENVPNNGKFDLWFVKNVSGGTVAPEVTDQTLKLGRFSGSGSSRSLDVALGSNVFYDLDLVVVTRAGRTPDKSVVAVGERTLFEKRLFRFRQGKGLDPVTGALASDVETNDPLVARGAELFFNETFGGNGRTCGTCHRAEHNLTIDPAFIAGLPSSDPLFIAENEPALAGLDDSALLRTRGLVRENVDGFDDPTSTFVERSVPHLLGLSLTNGIGNAASGPPDHRLGWSGDGAPGRGTLHEFTFGAIMQHLTKSLARKPGVDFRIPTEEELDALEAFQLFNGRQKPVNFSSLFPTDARAANGANLFFNSGCTGCHDDLFGFVDAGNLNFDTGVENLTPDLPDDDGFKAPGDRTFNVPPIVEAADTAPLFHNNAAATIEDAVAFYFSPTFQASPSSFFIFNQLSNDEQADVAAFLRVVNAFANLAQVEKRVQYVKSVRSPGNTDLLALALADTRDAESVLGAKNLNPSVAEQIGAAESLLVRAQADRDRNRPATMSKVLSLLDKASSGLLSGAAPAGTGSAAE